MYRMRASKSPERRAKIDALLAQTTPREMDVAAHVLTCITRGTHFDADEIERKHPKALELAYMHLGDDR